MPNKLSQIWQELKRRKVIKVIAMYAGAAYVLIELANNVVEPINLPDWTTTLVILILVVGFPIAVILSWIFDFTPEGIIKTEPASSESLDKVEKPPPSKATKAILTTGNIIIGILIVAVVILAYPRIFPGEKDPFERAYGNLKPIAVFPFSNHTGDAAHDYLEYGISEMMIYALSSSDHIRVLDNQTMTDMIRHLENPEKASIGPDLARKVASALEVESYITGDFLLAGSTLRIHLKLIDTGSSEVERSDFAEGPVDSIFSLAGKLAERIKNYLDMEMLGRNTEIAPARKVSTSSPEAYRYYILGLEKMWGNRGGQALTDLREAVRIDPAFTEAYFFLSLIETSLGAFTTAKELFLKADQGKNRMTGNMRLWHEAIRANYLDKNPYRSIDILQEAARKDPLSRMNWLWLGRTYFMVEEHTDALESCQQILRLNKKMGTWKNADFYNLISSVYLELGKYRDAERILKEGNEQFPDSQLIKFRQAACALYQNDSLAARIYIDQYRKLMERSREPDPMIIAYTGNIYAYVGLYEKAREFYRQALEERLRQGNELDTLQPGNHLYWYYLVYGISCGTANEDYEQAVANIEKARELSQEIYPDHPYVLISLGYAYYKLGRHTEAYELLMRAKETSTRYNHRLQKYLDQVEAALKN